MMTVNDAVANHNKLWLGIAEHIKETGIRKRSVTLIKQTVFDKLFPELADEHVEHTCFLCEFGEQRRVMQNNACYFCPLATPDDDGCLNGLFRKFCTACYTQDGKTAIKLAKQIAELPIVNPLYKEE